MPIGYNFSGNWEDYCALFRKFRLDALLKRLDSASQFIMNQSPSTEGYGVISTSMKLMDAKTRVPQKHDIFITAWGLIDLSYHAILSTNDYRGKDKISDDELKLLCVAESNFHEKQEHPLIETTQNTPNFMFYLWGFAGEQFKIQQLAKAFDNAGRELYILFEIAPKIGFDDIGNIVVQETGVSWPVLVASLLLPWLGFSRHISVDAIKRLTVWDNDFSVDGFQKVIDRYTATYAEIRNSELKRQIFYAKPYVLTERNKEVISINAFLNLFIYEHAVLWAVRDNYSKRGSQQFTSDFGQMFEVYFNELLSTYLTESEYSRIPEGERKRADWRINLCGYKLIVEQKSTILRLDAKQQNSNYVSMSDFAVKTVIKALKQLKSTEDEFICGKLNTSVDNGNREYIKVILLYDDYLNDNLLDTVFQMPECAVNNDYRYWMVTIDEFEILLYLYSINAEACKKIIEDKIRIDSRHGIEGSGLGYLLSQNGYETNGYLQKEKIKYYRNYATEFIRKHLPKSESKAKEGVNP